MIPPNPSQLNNPNTTLINNTAWDKVKTWDKIKILIGVPLFVLFVKLIAFILTYLHLLITSTK